MDIKTKKYTKEQIRGAINYWTRILENTSPFLDALVDDFDYAFVFNSSRKLQVRMKDIEKIYRLANSTIFGNKLKPIKIEEVKEQDLAACNASMYYAYNTYSDPKTRETTILQQEVRGENGKIYYPPKIYVNPSFLETPINLISLASIVVHEMIHQSIAENANGALLDRIFHERNENQGHIDKFIAMMDKINAEHGLNITEIGSASYEEDSSAALKKFAGSDYNIGESEAKQKLMIVKRFDDGFTQTILL